MKIAVLLANGFEEIEALAPVDILRRSGFEVDTISIDSIEVTGAHNIKVFADKLASEVIPSDYIGLILPGGMPGAENLDRSDYTNKFISAIIKNEGHFAAICAAPMILGKRGLLKGKRATCFPGFEKHLEGARCVMLDVITDGNVTTASGMLGAIEFGKELVSVFSGDKFKAIEENEECIDLFKKCLDQSIENIISSSTSNSFDDSFDTLDDMFEKESKLLDGILSEFIVPEAKYTPPSIDLLDSTYANDTNDIKEELSELGEKLCSTLISFNINVILKEILLGPRLVRFNVVPDKGTKANAIAKLSDDLALALAVESVRVEAPIPGKSSVGIEIPRKNPEIVKISELVSDKKFTIAKSPLTVAIGKGTDGKCIFGDVASMPHALVAGATGMGKSTMLNNVIMSIMFKASPEEVRLILIDPKQVEFSMYSKLPHLLVPIITDANRAAATLLWASKEMNRRYDLIEDAMQRNIDSYNEAVSNNPELGTPLPKIVIIIDELNDLMIQRRDPVENLIMIIAQKARAAGIHLIIGTQRPSASVITGVIKANIPTRFAFKTASGIDSRQILEQTGAEKLMGKGDAFYSPSGMSYPIRVQCAYASEREISALVDAAVMNNRPVLFDESIIAEINGNLETVLNFDNRYSSHDDEDDDDETSFFGDKKFVEAIELAIRNGSVATSFLQRKLRIGYGKAAQYIDVMEDLGICGEKDGAKSRNILINTEEWAALKERFFNIPDDDSDEDF